MTHTKSVWSPVTKRSNLAGKILDDVLLSSLKIHFNLKLNLGWQMQCQDCFYSSKIKLSMSRRDLTSNDNSNMHQYESRCSRNWIHPVINCTYTYSTSISIYGPNRFVDYIWLCTLITISFIRKFNKEATAKLTSYILSTRPACNRQGRKNLIKQISLSSRPIQMTSLSGGSIDEKSQTPKKWLN